MRTVYSRTEFLNELKHRLPENSVCCEIGVYEGVFSQKMYEILQPKKLILIDPFENLTDPVSKEDYYPNWGEQRTVYSNDHCLSSVNTRFSNEIQNEIVVIDKNLSTNALNNYEDGYFDLIYIDACHLYESAYWDIVNYFPKLKSGGIMSGHDYNEMEVFGVKRAVNEFCSNFDYEIELFNNESGDWALINKR